MARGIPISEETRAAIEADARENWGPDGVRVIAARHGVSATCVRRVITEAGLTAEGARAKTKMAAQQARVTYEEQRERLKARLIEEAHRSLELLDQGSVIAGFQFGEFVEGETRRITAADRKALLTSAAIALDKAEMIDKRDKGDEDGSDVAAVLRALTGRA